MTVLIQPAIEARGDGRRMAFGEAPSHLSASIVAETNADRDDERSDSGATV